MYIYIYIYRERERERERDHVYVYIYIYTHICTYIYIYIYIILPSRGSGRFARRATPAALGRPRFGRGCDWRRGVQRTAVGEEALEERVFSELSAQRTDARRISAPRASARSTSASFATLLGTNFVEGLVVTPRGHEALVGPGGLCTSCVLVKHSGARASVFDIGLR